MFLLDKLNVTADTVQPWVAQHVRVYVQIYSDDNFVPFRIPSHIFGYLYFSSELKRRGNEEFLCVHTHFFNNMAIHFCDMVRYSNHQ